jgi:hypothetical protein
MRLPRPSLSVSGRALAVGVLACMFAMPGFAQEAAAPGVTPSTRAGDVRTDKDTPAARAPANDDCCSPSEIRARRMALAAAEDYDGYAQSAKESELLDAYYAIEESPDSTPEQRKAVIDRMLDEIPLSFFTHSVASRYYRERYDASSPRDEALFETGFRHHRTAGAIIDSILESGDGESEATAWQVIHIGEEYLVLIHLELKKQKQSLVFGKNGKAYDVIEVTDKNGRKSRVYFDISSFFGKGILGR